MAKKNNNKGHVAPASTVPEQPQTVAQNTAITVLGKKLTGNDPVEHGQPESSASQIVTYTETDYSLVFPNDITEEQFLAVAKKLGHAAAGLGWQIGDIANFGKGKFGYKDYTKLAEVTGFAEVYLRTCSSLSERVAAEFRQLASMERFRLLLPRRETILPPENSENTVKRNESIPQLVARLESWTATDLREGAKHSPKAAPVVTMTQNVTTPAVPDVAQSTETDVDAKGMTSSPTSTVLSIKSGKPFMTANAIHDCAKTLQRGIEELTPDRLTVLAELEKRESVLKPLSMMLKILRDRIGTALNKA
jgi:hypothetical protein